LRLAAGICVLSTGLLIGSAGGAIAAADTDTSGSAPESTSADAAAASPASEPATSATAIKPGSMLRNTVTNTLALIGKIGQEQAAATKRLLTQSQTTVIQSQTTVIKNNDTASAVTEEAATAPVTDLTAKDATPLTSNVTDVAPLTTEAAPLMPAGLVTNDVVPGSTPITRVTEAVTTLVNMMDTVPGVLAGLTTSGTPVTDVITAVQQMLTSVTDTVLPLVTVPADLYALLAGPGVAGATIGGGVGDALGSTAVAGAQLLPSVTPEWAQLVPGFDMGRSRADVPALATARGVALAGWSERLSSSEVAPLAMQGITPAGVLPVLEHAVRALLVPASLSVLAAFALPGVCGLLIVCAAGIRIGYRQAKAGLMLRVSGIARFAGSGPLGVVRSGSLIAVRSRAARGARPTMSRALAFLDQAA